ncbi:MAG: FapA family protein [Planctomycetota bacterium]
MLDIPSPLRDLIREAIRAGASVPSQFRDGNVTTFEENILKAIADAGDPDKPVLLKRIYNDIKAYFSGSASDLRHNRGQVYIDLSEDRLSARITLLPPRQTGKSLSLHEVLTELRLKQIIHGIRVEAIQTAVTASSRKGEIIFSLNAANGTPPVPSEDAHIEFSVPVLDKTRIMHETGVAGLRAALPVKAGTLIGRVVPPKAGTPGSDVAGRRIPAPPGRPARELLGANLTLTPTETQVVSAADGRIVRSDRFVDIIPFYIVKGDFTAENGDLAFAGSVWVEGNVRGPVKIQCEDLYIEGNLEEAVVEATGEVIVWGGIWGKGSGTVETDGAVYARFISDAVIETMGDVLVRHSITHSTVTANGHIRVMGEQGAVLGGTLSALRGVEARVIGSDFGTFTRMTAGKDFLTQKRLNRILEKLHLHEENLRKITELKDSLAHARIDPHRLPPDKQDIFLGVLKKEVRSLQELAALKRRRERLNTVLKDFLDASVVVVEDIFPPAKVQIVDAILEIREKLNAIEFRKDEDEIRTTSPTPRGSP